MTTPILDLAAARKVLDTVDAGLTRGVGIPTPGRMCVEAAVCYALGLPHGDDPACVSRPLRSLKLRLNDSNWSSNRARAKGLRRLALAQLGSAGAIDDKEFGRRVVDLAIRKSVPAALRAAASKGHKHQAALLDAAARCEKEGTRQSALDAKETATVAAASATAVATVTAVAAVAAANAAAAASAIYVAYAAADAAAAASAAAAAYAANAIGAAVSTIYVAAIAASADDDKSLADFAEDVVQILIELKAPGCQWLDLAPR